MTRRQCVSPNMLSDRTLVRALGAGTVDLFGGPLLRACLGLFAVAIAIAMAGYYWTLGFLMNDFRVFYHSALLFRQGGDMYGPSVATLVTLNDGQHWQLWNMNPPHFHLLLLPLAWLPERTALGCWLAINGAAAAASVWLISRELRVQWTAAGLGWAALGALVFSATGATLFTGQLTFVIMLPVTAAWVAARRGRWGSAGVYLGAAASIKPFLGLFFLGFLAARRFGAAMTMIGASSIAAAAGAIVFGIDAYAGWLRSLSAVDWRWAAMNGSFAGIVSRSLAENPSFAPIVHAPQLVGIATTTLSVVVGGVALALIARSQRLSVDWLFVLLLLSALLASPLGWIYYLWLVVGPMAGLFVSSWGLTSRTQRAMAVLAVPGVFCPLVFLAGWSATPWASWTVGSIYFWTAFCLWLMTALTPASAVASAS